VFDAYKTIYTLAGLALIGGKGSDSIGWQIYHTKLAFIVRSQKYKFLCFGKTITDGLLMRYVAPVS